MSELPIDVCLLNKIYYSNINNSTKIKFVQIIVLCFKRSKPYLRNTTIQVNCTYTLYVLKYTLWTLDF